MKPQLSGLGRMTNVAHPLEQLGTLTREAEAMRQRTRWRLEYLAARHENTLNGLAGTILLISACLSVMPSLRQSEERHATERAAAASVAAPIAAEADVASRPEAAHESSSAYRVASEEPQSSTSARASVLAFAGDRLPATVEALSATRAEPKITDAVSEVELLFATGAELDLVRPLPTAVLTQLPPETKLSKGTSLGDGIWAAALEDLEGLELLSPASRQRQIKARVEIDGQEGGKPANFALLLRPASSAVVLGNDQVSQGARGRAKTAKPTRRRSKVVQQEKAVKQEKVAKQEKVVQQEKLPWLREVPSRSSPGLGWWIWGAPSQSGSNDRGADSGVGRSWGYANE